MKPDAAKAENTVPDRYIFTMPNGKLVDPIELKIKEEKEHMRRRTWKILFWGFSSSAFFFFLLLENHNINTRERET